MQNYRIKIIGALLLAGLTLTLATAAHAQNVSTINTACTNKLAPAIATTANMGNAVIIDEQQQAQLLVQGQGDAAGTDIIIVQLKRGNENYVFETAPPASLRFTNSATGTTPFANYFQIPKEVIGSSYCLTNWYATNASGTVNITNFSVSIVKKGEKIRGP